MQQESSRVHNTISLDSLNFEVISYKVDHVKTLSSYFTMSNDTRMYTNGIKPFILTIKGYFPKNYRQRSSTIPRGFAKLFRGCKLYPKLHTVQ
jgi:hypothetical protein